MSPFRNSGEKGLKVKISSRRPSRRRLVGIKIGCAKIGYGFHPELALLTMTDIRRQQLDRQRQELRLLGFGRKFDGADSYGPSRPQPHGATLKGKNAPGNAFKGKRSGYQGKPLGQRGTNGADNVGSVSSSRFVVEELDILRRKNRQLTNETSSLSSQLTVQTRAVESLRRKLSQLYTSDRKLEGMNHRLTAENHSLKQTNRDLEQELGERLADLKAVVEENQVLKLSIRSVDLAVPSQSSRPVAKAQVDEQIDCSFDDADTTEKLLDLDFKRDPAPEEYTTEYLLHL